MRPVAALRAAIEADRQRQVVEVMHDVLMEYGVNAYYRNQAHIWWGWSL